MMGRKLEYPLHYLRCIGCNGERTYAWQLIITHKRAILYSTGEVPILDMCICCTKFHCPGVFPRFGWHTGGNRIGSGSRPCDGLRAHMYKCQVKCLRTEII